MTTNRTDRLIGWALILLAAGLAGWTAWLGASLDLAEHPWHWVLIDGLEVTGLLAAGAAAVRRAARLAATAALLTSPLFVIDAMLDVSSSHLVGSQLAEATAMALCAEIPTAAFLAWVASRAFVRNSRATAAI